MITSTSIFFVLLAGIAFGLMNTVYRLGQQLKVPTQSIAFIISLLGTAYYVALTWPALFWQAPWQTWGLGIAVGFSQYLMILLVATALRHGPLSPMNCAMFLGFVLIILMARLLWNEYLSTLQGIGVGMAVLCVIVASFQTDEQPQARGQPRTFRTWLVYAGILCGLFVVNAIANGAFKVLGMVPTSGVKSYAGLYGNHYLTTLYITLAVCLGLDMLLSSKPQGPLRWRLGLGLIAGIGSIAGMSSMRLCASLPAAFTFPVVALTLILGGSLVSVFCFGERTSRAWWTMMVTGSIAAVCLIADALITTRLAD